MTPTPREEAIEALMDEARLEFSTAVEQDDRRRAWWVLRWLHARRSRAQAARMERDGGMV